MYIIYIYNISSPENNDSTKSYQTKLYNRVGGGGGSGGGGGGGGGSGVSGVSGVAIATVDDAAEIEDGVAREKREDPGRKGL